MCCRINRFVLMLLTMATFSHIGLSNLQENFPNNIGAKFEGRSLVKLTAPLYFIQQWFPNASLNAYATAALLE